MKKLVPLLLAVILILPACTTQKGGGNMANMLYNGVELPALPEWDKTTYPYAYMQVLDASEFEPSLSGTIVGLAVTNKKAVFGSVLDDCLTITAPYNEVVFLWTDSQGLCDMYAGIGLTVSLAEWNSFGETTHNTDFNDSAPVIWSNYDILNADGSIYLAASTPAPVGVANGDGMALYNGVMLPRIESVWADKETCSFAGVFYFGHIGTYVLSLMEYPLAVSSDETKILSTGAQEVKGYKLSSDGSAWEFFQNTTCTTGGAVGGLSATYFTPVWCNFDMYTEGGTVFLSASDPIPLDGMNVITWDGDPSKVTDLSSVGFGGNYIVSNTVVDFKDGDDYICVVWNGDRYVTYPQWAKLDYTSESMDGESYWSLGAGPLSLVGGYNIPSAGVVGMVFTGTGVEGGFHTALFAYPASSTGGEDEEKVEATVFANSITDTSATAWLMIQGLDSNTEYTAEFAVYRNDATGVLEEVRTFIGSDNIQYHEFTGLLPETDYVLAVNVYPTGGESVYFGECEFTTLEASEPEGPDYSDAFLEVSYEELTTNSAYLEVNFSGIPQGDDVYTYLDCKLDDGTEARENPLLVDNPPSDNESGVLEVYFDDLEPGKTYTATFRLMSQLFGQNGYTDAGVGITYEFTTEAKSLDFSEAYMEMVEVTPSSTSAFFRVGCYKFPSEEDGGMILFPVTGTTSDGKTVDMAIKSAASGASFVRGTLNGLEPNTEYTVTFEAFHEGVSTGVTLTTTFKTAAYDRDGFLLGMALRLIMGGFIE